MNIILKDMRILEVVQLDQKQINSFFLSQILLVSFFSLKEAILITLAILKAKFDESACDFNNDENNK